MDVTELGLKGLLLIRPQVHRDSRGWFLETYSAPRYERAGIFERFVQDNHSCSAMGTLRGLHYQGRPGQAKLVRVSAGSIFDVAVDLRPHSNTFGKWVSVVLSSTDRAQLYLPVGFAHGFCVLSNEAEVEYKVSSPYDAAEERTLAWNDPDIAVQWPIEHPVLSARDQAGESFACFRKRVGV